MGREDEIRLIAYNIWEEESCPNGRDCEHWFRAEVVWEQQKKSSGKKEGSKAASKQSGRSPGKAKASKKKKQT